MLGVLAALLPVALLVVLGSALKAKGFPGDGFWQPAERLVCLAFLPALIVTTLAEADLRGLQVLPLLAGPAGALAIVVGLLLALRTRLRVEGPAGASAIPGATRPNAYVALSVCAAVWGSAGLTVAVICIAVILPAVDAICGIARAHRGAAGSPSVTRSLTSVAGSPLLAAVVVGLVGNFTGVPTVAGDVLEILGQPALPVGLLCVGAALDWRALRGTALALALAHTGALKLLAMPALTAAIHWGFGVEGVTAAVALAVMAAPSATATALLPHQANGDAELTAGLTTGQTLAAGATLPAILTLAG